VRIMNKKLPPHLIAMLKKYKIAIPDENKGYSSAELNQIIDRVEHLIQQKKRGRLDAPNHGNTLFLTNIMQLITLAITGAVALLAEQGLGATPAKDEHEKRFAKEFSFDLMMHMVMGSGLTTHLFKAIAKTTGANETKQKIITEALEVSTFLIAVHAATKGNEDRMASLFESFSPKIGKSLDTIGNYINDEINSETISEGVSQELSLKIQQAKLALQNGEPKKFITVCKGALGLLNISPDLLEKNIKEIELFVNTLIEAMSTKEENTTAIAQAM
jgi:hypothetical protein